MNLSNDEEIFIAKLLAQNYAFDNESDEAQYNAFFKKLSREGYHVFNKYSKENQISEPLKESLFFGMGFRSIIAKNKVHKRLNYACDILSGIQQLGLQSEEFDKKQYQKGNREIKKIIKDISFSLGID